MTQNAATYIQRIQREQQRTEQKLAQLRRLWKYASRMHLPRPFMRDLETLLGKYAQPLHDEREHLARMMEGAERGAEVSARQWARDGDEMLRVIGD